MNALFFVLFSVFSGLMVISSYHPVHSVLWLVLAFLSAAGLFLLYDVTFIALIVVIVYVGAIATLFLFVVMLLQLTNCAKGAEDMTHYLPVAFLVGVVFLSGLLSWVGRPVGLLSDCSRSNVEVMGQLLYTDFLYLLLLASFVLLAAMIGAIVLVGGFMVRSKSQDLFSQVSRFPK